MAPCKLVNFFLNRTNSWDPVTMTNLYDRSRTQEEGPNEALAHHHSTVGPKVWYVYSRRKKNVANPNDS